MTAPTDAGSYFDGRTSLYDRSYDRIDADGHALRARLAAVLAAVGRGPGAALDAGMGPGRLCAELDRQGWTVSGIDASDEMVATARARIPEATDRLLAGKIERLPWGDACFDAVTATGVLEYSDIPMALAEVTRVLRPGGRAVVSYPNPRALYGVWKAGVWYPAIRTGKRLARRADHRMPRGAGALDPARFTRSLEAAGLQVDSYEHVSYLVLPTPLDGFFPRTSARLGARLEGGRNARLLATQVVYAARKPD